MASVRLINGMNTFTWNLIWYIFLGRLIAGPHGKARDKDESKRKQDGRMKHSLAAVDFIKRSGCGGILRDAAPRVV